MRVTCESWRSHWQGERISDNPHVLVKHDIAKLTPSKKPQIHWWELETSGYIRSVDDSVEIETGVENLNLHGNHVVRVRLTRNEIANLVKIAWADKSFAEFVEALSQRTANNGPNSNARQTKGNDRG